MIRVARVGRLYKLVKLTRLLRILKLIKEKAKLLKYLNNLLKVGLAFERLFFFFLISIIVVHIVTCLFVIVAAVSDHTFKDTWIEAADIKDKKDKRTLYITSLYWTITTFTTVGYGDISATSSQEQIFCSIMMVVGVIAFSYANGTLSSIIQNFDQTNAEFTEKLMILNRIYKDYCLPLDLYIMLRKNLKYEYQKDFQDINKYIDDLPNKLRIKVSLYIYEERYRKIKYFKKVLSASFITWICP